MTKTMAVSSFKAMLPVNEFFDYWRAFEMWSVFTDGLCKDGQITERQRSTWSTPFQYGRTVAVNLNGKFYYKSTKCA